MRYMVMHYQTQDMEDGVPPSPEQQTAIGEYMQEAAMSGVFLTGEGVASSSKGARVEVTDGTVRVIDGPFAEAKELIAGFSLVEAGSLEEVIDMVKDWPRSDGHGNVQVEIRQIATAEDLGFSDEQQKRYDRMVEQEAAQQQ